MEKLKKLAGVWGAGIFGLVIFYFIKGGEIEGVDIGAGKVFLLIVGGVLYGTYRVLNTKNSDQP